MSSLPQLTGDIALDLATLVLLHVAKDISYAAAGVAFVEWARAHATGTPAPLVPWLAFLLAAEGGGLTLWLMLVVP